MPKKHKDISNSKIYEPMRFWWVYFAISLSVLIPGVSSLIKNGLKLGIDFTGGSSISWIAPSLTKESIVEAFENQNISVSSVTLQGEMTTITTPPIDRNDYSQVLFKVKDSEGFKELSFDTVGPSLGAELIKKTFYGIAAAASLILLYVAYRFKNFKFGVSAIIAMLHDLFVVLGIFSLLGKYAHVEVDTLFVTALLTILSFSVHDTIVVFDRVREIKKQHAYLTFEEITNRAVVETMARSINNSMTIIFMLLAMYLLGGTTIKWFILALLVGTASGTYSSTFTAAPILVIWERLSKKLR